MIWLAGGIVLAASAAAIAFLKRRYVAVQVRGTSMTPALRDGDRVLVRRCRLDRVGPGDVVVVAMPSPSPDGDPPWLVKRVVAVPGDPVPHARFPNLPVIDRVVPPGRLVLLSDDPAAGYDSRRVGYFAGETLLGVVVRTVPSPAAGNRQ